MEKERTVNPTNNTIAKADRVEITYYTDPLCCWSWAFEPEWRRLRYEFDGYLTWSYVMSGLLPSWKNYNDEINSVSKPIQMGPIWMQASHMSGMPMPSKIWIENPPASSYPACIAVKCAQLQSHEAGEKYLRLTREAIMLHNKNIADQSVLLEVAEKVHEEQTGFDLFKFRDDLKNDNGIEAFRQDLQQVQYRNINRYPTLIFRKENCPPIITTGYRPYSELLNALHQIAPAAKKNQVAKDDEAYKQYWGNVTERELAEIKKT